MSVFSSHYSLGACLKASYRWIGCHHLPNSFPILGHSNDFSFAHRVKITNLCVGRVVKLAWGWGAGRKALRAPGRRELRKGQLWPRLQRLSWCQPDGNGTGNKLRSVAPACFSPSPLCEREGMKGKDRDLTVIQALTACATCSMPRPN